MTIKNLLSKFRMSSNAKIMIHEVNGNGIHTISREGVKEWLDKDSETYNAPILFWKVNSFEIVDNVLTIYAEKR